MAEGDAPHAGDEIAVAYGTHDITRSFLRADGTLYNEDSVLQLRAGGDLSVYADLMRDDQVKSAWEQRASALVSAGWSVKPGADDAASIAAADFLSSQLEEVGWDEVTRLALFTRFYGFGVAELVWKVTDDGRLGWSKIAVRNRERFLFTADGRCYLRTLSDSGAGVGASRVWCDAPNFWIMSSGADHADSPYGIGLAHNLFWPVRFKRDGLRFWMVYLEKFAMPTALGKFKAGSTAADKSRLLAAVLAIQTQAGVTIPEDMAIELLEAKRNGSGDYSAVCSRMDAAIQKIILGQTLTSEVGSTGGNRALGDVHMGVRQSIVKQDADLICESFNRGPARWITRANFAGAAYPMVQREVSEPENLDALSSQLERLSRIGYRLNLDAVREKWGSGIEAAPPTASNPAGSGDLPSAPGRAEFSTAVAEIFADQAALDGSLDRFETHMESLSRELLDPVLSYVAGHSPAEVMAAMHDALPDYRGDKLEDALARVLFAGMVWGRANGAE